MSNNLVDYSNWTIGVTGTISGDGEYSSNYWDAYGDNEDENEIKYAPDPWGKTAKVWEGTSSGNDSDGGGIQSGYIAVDTSYTYRLAVWTRRKAEYGTSAEGDYFGPYVQDSDLNNVALIRLNTGADDTNPYFDYWEGDVDDFDIWILRIGHVFPEGVTDYISSPYDGGWFIDGTRDFYNSRSFAFKSGVNTAYIRLRSFYWESVSHNANFVQQWAYPRIEKCDGTEPSLESLLRNQTFYKIVKVGGRFLKLKVKDI